MTTGYFDRFPKINFDLTGNPNNNPIVVVNIFFRFHILNAILNNSLVYYPYYIDEGATPETIASRYYGDITKGWVVMMANKIVDPQYDWPLPYQAFITYIENKYGSIPQAEQHIHEYQKIVTKQDSVTGNITTNTIVLDETTYNNTPGFTFNEINLIDGSTVTITTTTNIYYSYQHEKDLNESKKNIILIDKQYISQIDSEFQALINQA
jgi:hypothetical protein